VSAKIEWSNEVDAALGHDIVERFIAEVREGKIKKEQVKHCIANASTCAWGV
jgi:hypothetical protein